MALASLPRATDPTALDTALGPIAIASVPVAPSLFILPASEEFTEKYFTFAAFN